MAKKKSKLIDAVRAAKLHTNRPGHTFLDELTAEQREEVLETLAEVRTGSVVISRNEIARQIKSLFGVKITVRQISVHLGRMLDGKET